MIGWLWRVLVGSFYICRHKWEVREEISGYRPGAPASARPSSFLYVLNCTRCGEITSRKVQP